MKNNLLLKTIFFVSIATLQIWFAYVTFQYPYLGIVVEKNMMNEWTIKNLEADSVSLQLDLQIGDIIQKVNNRHPSEYFSIQKWRYIDQSDTVLISRNGTEFEIATNGDQNSSQIAYLPLSGVLLGFSIAVYLFLKWSRSKSARILSLVFLTIGLIYMSYGAAIRGDSLGKIAITSLMMVLPILFLHFLIVFFKEKGNIQLPVNYVKYLYSIVVLLSATKILYFFPSLAYIIYRDSALITILYFIIGFLLCFILLTLIYFRYRKANNYLSTLIKSVWFSILLSIFPIITLSLIPNMIIHKELVNSVYTSWFILFFPLSLLYLIVTKKVYDIDLVLRRIMYMMLISIIPSALIVGFNAIIFQNDASAIHLFLSFLFILIIFTFVLYSLEYFATRLEVVMFPRKYHLQSALQNIAKNLRSITSFLELKDIVLVDIVNTLQVYGCAIVFKYKDDIESIGQGEIDLVEVEKLLISGTLEDSFYSCFEINRHEEYTSYLITTSKKTNTMIGVEDTKWLDLIISYLAVSMENAYLIRKLTMRLQKLAARIPNEHAGEEVIWFRKSMFEIQEKERFRIATDLHDTTMQDILLVKAKLTPLLEKYSDRVEDRKVLVGIMNHLELVNENLRQSCFELHPYLLQRIGLVNTIEKLIDMESGVGLFEIQFNAEGADKIELLDMDAKRHIFRMVQELINNAKKHSQARKVVIKLTSISGDFCLNYEDNGIGFDVKALEEDERLTTIAKSGIGIEQMKSRILHLNGYVEVDSRVGKGVRINIRIPMKEGLTA